MANTSKKAPQKVQSKKAADELSDNIGTVADFDGDKEIEKTEKTETKAPILAEEEKAETYSKTDVEKMIADAVAKAVANVKAQPVQVISYAADTEKVHFLWQAEVADDNVMQFGDNGIYGQIVGKTGSFYVPKSDISRVLTELNRELLRRRWLIVVSGLTDEEREALGVDYKDGEILDKAAFAKMVELGDKILSIYPELCDGHKKMVAQRYAEAYENGNPLVTRELVTKLNSLSKSANSPRGEFVEIIEKMNAKDVM